MIILMLKKLFKWKTVAYLAYNSAVCIQALMYYVNLYQLHNSGRF